jgi:hypothetical protein
VAGVEDDVFIFSGMFDNTSSTVRKAFAVSPDFAEPIKTLVGVFTEVVKVELILI